MLLILFFISMLGFFIFVSKRLKLAVEFTPIFVFSSIISILYLFSLIGLLKITVYLLFVLGIILFIGCLAIYKKKILDIFTPGFTFFLFIFLFVWINYHNYISTTWDDFSHWGLVVKEMIYYNGLTDNMSAVHFKEYPPGMALFQYYFSILTTNAEGTWFIARNILIISAITTITKGFTWKRSGFVLLILALFYYLFENFGAGFNILYIDALLSALFGFILVQYFANRKDDYHLLLYLVPQLFILPLIKSMGFVLAGFIIVIIICDQIIQFVTTHKIQVIRNFRSISIKWVSIFILMAVICSPLISNFTWSTYVKSNNFAITFKTEFGLRDMIQALSPNATGRTLNTQEAFKSAFENKPIAPGDPAFPITVKKVTLLLIGLSFLCLIVLVDRGPQLYRMYGLHSLLFLFFLCYSFILFIMYRFSFSEYEGNIVASYERYMETYLLGWMIVLLVIPISKLYDITNNWRKNFAYILIVFFLLSILNITPLKTAEAAFRENVTLPTRLNVLDKSSQVNNLIPINAKTYIIWQNTTGLEYWMLSYELAPRLTNLGIFSLGSPYNENDIWTVNYTIEEWSQILLDQNYEYILLGNSDEQFWNQYGEMFEKSDNYKNNLIFKVSKLSDGTMKLIAVN